MRLKFKEDPKEWRKQALLTVLGLAIINSLLLWRHHVRGNVALVLYAALLGIAILAIACPHLFRSYYRFAMRLGYYFSLVLGRVVLTLFFFLVLTPLGIILRLCGKDSLQLKRPAKADSYWQTGKEFGPLDKLF